MRRISGHVGGGSGEELGEEVLDVGEEVAEVLDGEVLEDDDHGDGDHGWS